MPTDPKWRTISRISKKPISLVISVYVTLLCSASQNVTRGHADVTIEDIASQLDVTDDEIQAIFDAMQGRVLQGFELTGWEKRQPKREDLGSESGAKSAAERKRAQRERQRALDDSNCHELSRSVTTDKDKDKDTDTDKPSSDGLGDKPPAPPRQPKKEKPEIVLPEWVSKPDWENFEAHRKKKRKGLDELSRPLMIEKLAGLTTDEQRQVIEYSIGAGYPDLYPDRIKQKSLGDRQSQNQGLSKTNGGNSTASKVINGNFSEKDYGESVIRLPGFPG